MKPDRDRLGEGRRVHLVTFGCQMNNLDSEIVEAGLLRQGFQVVADPSLADAVLCRIMDVPLRSVAHLRFGDDRGRVPALAGADLPDDLDRYLDDRFYLKRNLWNRVAKLTWYSPRLNHLVYFSKASSALHKVMYAIREKPDELSARGVDWD